MNLISGRITTRDQVGLNFIEAGGRRPLVFIPGWSQTAAMFRYQLEDLSKDYRVVALDMRGHGDADKPAHGYRIASLAADLRDALEALDLNDVVLAGHSMGCSIIWSYLGQFGDDRVSRLLLIDQAPAVTAWPNWTQQQKADCGSIFTAQQLFEKVMKFAGPDGITETVKFIKRSFFTGAFPRELTSWVVEENLKFPRLYAARLLLDHGAQDWRDAIARIRLPTLVVGAEKSIFTVASQQWISRQIPDAQLEIFAENEGGSHFMWLENPVKFNQLVRRFAD